MTSQFIRPAPLVPGDAVAVLSLSWGGANLFPRAFERGLQNLERSFGVRIIEYPTTRATPEFLFDNPRRRAEDLNHAFADASVRAIVSAIGGDDSVRILPYVDVENAIRNPKIVMGFSDTTTLLALLNQHGLVTFNGPSVLAGFANLEHHPQGAVEHVHRVLCERWDSLEYRPFGVRARRFQSWADPSFDGRLDLVSCESGFAWLQGSGVRRGRLFGGCIEVLEFLKGTKFWPEPEFWNGRILFLETSEDKPSPTTVGTMLRNYGVQGVFDRIEGLLFGHPYKYSEQEREDLHRVIVRVVAREFAHAELPVIADMDFGHDQPQFVMPNGGLVEIDCGAHSVRLVESPVA